LVRCPFFHLDYVRENAPFECHGEGHMQVWLILAGTGSWDLPDRQEEARRGQAWILPAAMPRTWFRPEPEVDFLKISMASPSA
jgi:mannose-6-phosphate isomerase-like protein (cupin superfamily)